MDEEKIKTTDAHKEVKSFVFEPRTSKGTNSYTKMDDKKEKLNVFLYVAVFTSKYKYNKVLIKV